jgi:hypothetical protein
VRLHLLLSVHQFGDTKQGQANTLFVLRLALVEPAILSYKHLNQDLKLDGARNAQLCKCFWPATMQMAHTFSCSAF